MVQITEYTTESLKEMRDYQEAMEMDGKNIQSDFTLPEIVNELTRRYRFPADDEQPDKTAICAATSF